MAVRIILQGTNRRPFAFFRDLVMETWQLIRLDAPLYLVVIVYCICGLLFLDITGTSSQAAYAVYLDPWTSNFLITMPIIALSFDAFIVIHRFDSRRMLGFRRSFSASRLAHLVSGVAFLMLFMLFQGTYTSIKNALPVWEGGFVADHSLADIDRWLHFGQDPWHYLCALGDHDFVRRMVEINYNVVWFIICFGALFYVVTSPRIRHVRSRYLVVFMLVWIVCGNIFAGLFLSGGPAFYGEITGDHIRFGEQLAFLARSAGQFSSAADYQNYLWSLYVSSHAGFGSGISAFPSVHVGMITMNALFLAEYSRRWGIVAFAYVAFIMASSVYLAWHYAIDGYASVMIVTVIYFAVKKLLPLKPRQSRLWTECAAGARAG